MFIIQKEKTDKPFYACTSVNLQHEFQISHLVGTPDPSHKLHEYIDGDGVRWPNLSLFGWETGHIWTHLIVYFIYLELFMLSNLTWWVDLNNEMF